MAPSTAQRGRFHAKRLAKYHGKAWVSEGTVRSRRAASPQAVKAACHDGRMGSIRDQVWGACRSHETVHKPTPGPVDWPFEMRPDTLW